MRTAVLINNHSRQARQNLKAVKKYFSRPDCPFRVIDFIVIEQLDDFAPSLERVQSNEDMQCLIIGSGDGTIISTLNLLKKRSDLVYGFIPLGTGNAFVRSLGIPLDIKKSLLSMGDQYIRSASLGQINDTVFLNAADIGVAVQVAENLTNKLKRYLGTFAYVVSGVRETLRHDPFWCELEVDGRVDKFQSHHIQISNGSARVLATDEKSNVASAYDNELTIAYSTNLNRWEYLKDIFGFVIARPEKREHLYYVTAQKAKLTTKPVQTIQADGEIIGKTPAKIEIVTNAIRVLAPAPQPEKPAGKRRRGRRGRS